MPAIRTLCTGLLLLILLAGCNPMHLLDPPSKQGQNAIDDFIFALRWQQYPAAAALLANEHQEAFLASFQDLNGLDIVDVELETVHMKDEGRRAETTIRMEYYLLPSAAVKTFRFKQTWALVQGMDMEKQEYRAVTPFPPFP